MEEFKDRFLYALADAGMTQAEIARKCNLATSAVSNYATGRMIPKTQRLHDIAVALGVNELWLVSGIGEKKRVRFLMEDDQELLRYFHQLSAEKRKIIIDLVKSIAEQFPEEV